jgi:cytochrome c-type biogenesis protein CcmH/NrfF
MSRFRRSFALALLATAAAVTVFAQSEAQIQSDSVKRVGTHINCQCGACNENVNCMMSAGECHFCKPARTKIFQMQQSGMSDQDIVQQFIKEYGEKIFRPDPNSSFWIVPYISLALGGLVLWFVLRRMRHSGGPLKPAAVGPSNAGIDPELARYLDAAEKETDRLER